MCLLGLAVLGLKAGGDGCAGRAMRRGRLERRDHSHLSVRRRRESTAQSACRAGAESCGPMGDNVLRPWLSPSPAPPQPVRYHLLDEKGYPVNEPGSELSFTGYSTSSTTLIGT